MSKARTEVKPATKSSTVKSKTSATSKSGTAPKSSMTSEKSTAQKKTTASSTPGKKTVRKTTSRTKATTGTPAKAKTTRTTKQATAKKAAAPVKKTRSKDAATKKPATARVKPDNLKLIEGIGPKIEQILKRRGIKTFEQLGASKVGELREILKKAGSRYSLAEPKTWPRQARYAAKGQMAKLKEYQDKLKGGREV